MKILAMKNLSNDNISIVNINNDYIIEEVKKTNLEDFKENKIIKKNKAIKKKKKKKLYIMN